MSNDANIGIATLCSFAAIVVLAEVLWKKNVLKGEYARKFVHISLSLLIAILPFYISWNTIISIGVISIIALLVLRITGWFKSFYDITRKSIGDVIGPLAILGLACLHPSRELFVIAVLHTGLADGLAAIFGTWLGKSNTYTVMGTKKSVVGTVSFFVCSVGIMFAAALLGEVTLTALIIIPILTTIAENIGIYGIDNALIIIVTTVSLTLLK